MNEGVQQSGQPSLASKTAGRAVFAAQPAQRFLAHLLGIESERPVSSQMMSSRNRAIGWASVLQALNFSNAFQGINFTPNFLFLVLFVGFTAWLGVVYWIRHNEPFANAVIGNGAAYSATQEADRKLVNAIKKTFPVRTCPTSGEIYVPIPGQQGGQQNSAPQYSERQPIDTYNPTIPPQLPAPPPQPVPLNQYYGSPVSNVVNGPYATGISGRSAYLLPIYGGNGPRVKMIVNR